MMAETNFEYADVPISAGVHTPKTTPDEVLALAKKIWKEIEESGIDKNDDTGNEKLLERIQSSYDDFNKSFPVVLRWMVQMREFRPKAFKTYLLKHATADLSTREKFLELQADYLILLYRDKTRHPDEKFIQNYRSKIIKNLLDEDKAFLKIQEEAAEHIKELDATNAAERRKALYSFIKSKTAAENSNNA